jgi:hypothetical protein
MSFDDWFKELVSDEIWASPAKMHHRPETFRKVANQVWMEYNATGFPPIAEARRHVYYKIVKVPGDNQKVNWRQAEPEKKEEWIPVTGEERQRRLFEYKKLIDSLPMVNAFPRITEKEKAENSDWIPAKGQPYPSMSLTELQLKARHLEWIKANYDARTGKPLPTWVSVEEWNLLYVNNLL